MGGVLDRVGVRPVDCYLRAVPVNSGDTLRLAVDATQLLVPRTGIGTFTAELLKELGRRPDLEVSAFTTGRAGRHWLPDDVRGAVQEIPGRLPSRIVRRMWQRLAVPSVEWLTGGVDVVHGPNYLVPPTRRAATVLSIHDVGFEFEPPMSMASALAHRETVRAGIGRGAWVHTVSEYVAQEVRDIYDVSPDRVVAVPNGARLASPGPHPAPGAPYVLAMGTADRRKDLTTLVAAFDQVAPEFRDLRLIHAGPDGDASEELDQAISHSPHRQRILRLGWVDDHTRSSLFHEASVVAYPSLYEGFGLVPLEAMLTDTPVVTTKVAAIPEVVGEAALFATPGDPDELAEALRRALGDAEQAASLVAAGRTRVADYTWERTAAGMAALYLRARDEQ